MALSPETPLAAPPRKVHLRRTTKNVRRAYRTLFALITLILAGWAALDLIHREELSSDRLLLDIGFCIAAGLAFAILRFVAHPYLRELRLARSGYLAQGQIVSVDLSRGRRRRGTLCYTFTTVAGDRFEGRCVLPRRFPLTSLEPGQDIDVLYDPARPLHNKPRVALEHVEFVEAARANLTVFTIEDSAMKKCIVHLLYVPMIVLLFLPPASFSGDKTKLPEKIAPFFRPPSALANDFGGYRSPLQFADGTPVKTKDEWRKRRGEIAKTWHGLMGEWLPLVQKPKIEYLAKERRENFTQHHVRIEIAPGRFTDDAYLLVPDGDGPFPAVVVVFYEAKTGIGQNKSPLRDFAYQLAKRGFVTLSVGSSPNTYFPNKDKATIQPLSFHAYVAANCYQLLASLPFVDARLIGIVGHSYGGKWALFASCLYDRFAGAAWSDPGIVFDEKRSNVNYWEPWYLGYQQDKTRKPGIPTKDNPRTGPYKTMMEKGHDLHELHALMAPRPFLVSGGAEDPVERWKALNHTVAVNKLLGYDNRVAMTNRKTHSPTEESNEQMYLFFEHFLKDRAVLK